jgi:20S proteasome alpha/beta subunit
MAGVVALALTARGIMVYEYSPEPYLISDKFCAIGSGAQAALAVMHMGYTTREAVKVAAKIDPYTGGRVRTLKL